MLDIAPRAQPPTHLQLEARFARELGDEGAVARVRAALPGAVQIDDMQPVRAQRAVLVGESERRRGVRRRALEVPLQQPHTAAVLQVDGGNEVHTRASESFVNAG